MAGFATFKLRNSLLTTLRKQGLETPTDIQARTIPTLLAGGSLVGVAETGGGKTLAFALPILQRLKALEDAGEAVTVPAQPRALILVPTRELGEQVSKVFKLFTHDTRLRVRTVLGGTTMEVARRNIAGAFEVLVATPGRLVQLLDRELVSLVDVRTLVFDEVDQMLDQGFLRDAERLAGDCPVDRQMVLFSATVSPTVHKLIASLFAHVEVIESQGSHRLPPTLRTENRFIKDGKRFPVLEKMLTKPYPGGTVLFANTREQCDKVVEELLQKGHACVAYRGEMDKVERRSNLKSFRDGKVSLLVATDLASRGLDVEHVGRVVNYHLPREIENYLHRVGRTARAGRDGLVVNFVTERDAPLMKQVDALTPKPKGKRS